MMKFELDEIVIEEASRASRLAVRVLANAPGSIPRRFVEDARSAAWPERSSDPFGAGKRRMIIMQRRSPFLMACPAGSAKFACCGYLVLTLASNCPMDCSYCFLQEYLADNPGLQVYANYRDCFDELDRLSRSAPERHFRIGTGELCDSLAFDSTTEMSRDLVEFFAQHPNLTLELKTKTDEIENLLAIDPRGRAMVSWTLSPERVYRSSEHRTAPPDARIAAAARVLDAGYRAAFHLDPVIAYEGADKDYLALLDQLFSAINPSRISFISMGGLRMTPGLRAAARRRFPGDTMLLGEDVLSPDGRYRSFLPLRMKLYRAIAERIKKSGIGVAAYLCMETASVHERIFGATPPSPAAASEMLAIR